MEEHILEILEQLADTCKEFAENVDRELRTLGTCLSFAYDAEFANIQRQIKDLQKLLK